MYLLRRPGELLDTVPGRDVALAASLAFIALLAGVHMIRRLSTQDPPPAGESRLIGFALILTHGTMLALGTSGMVEGIAGSREVPASWHVFGVLIGAAMLTASRWLPRPRPPVL